MSISEDEAVEVARKHGLGLSDAFVLQERASDVEHADRLAAAFSPDQTPEALADAVRQAKGY